MRKEYHHKMLILLPLLGVFLNSLTAQVEANLMLGFKATKILRQHNPANCTIGNTTYAHGQTFKLDCKTQCVCENGRHACSSLCPKEQLPAPEDTISCRSPRLVEVPGHCCKMWLCENPTADVYATCHNSSASPWTACSQACGLGISTRFTSTTTGCHQLSSLRLCENRKCDLGNKDNLLAYKQKLSSSIRGPNNLVLSEQHKHTKDSSFYNSYHVEQQELQQHMPEHRIRKGHECRSIQRFGSTRIRLGACISKKLYRPKLCGRCQHVSKCCTPSVSTTIQVELLCPLNAEDPISFAEQQQSYAVPLWDTVSLEPIDQEFLQSHQIQIENKFIAVEWILKCECSKNSKCNNNNNGSRHNNSHTDSDTVSQIDNSFDNALSSSELLPDIIPYPHSRKSSRTTAQAKQHQRQRLHKHERERPHQHRRERT